MYTKLLDQYNSVFSLSDVHGNMSSLVLALQEKGLLDDRKNIQLKPNDYLIINGDIFDYFYKNDNRIDMLGVEFCLSVLSTFTMSEKVRLYIKNYIETLFNHEDNEIIIALSERLDRDKIRRETISGFLVLELLSYLIEQKKILGDRLILIIGNHDYDFISGDWFYRSLQKNIISWVLFDQFGLEYLERKDYKVGKQPIQVAIGGKFVKNDSSYIKDLFNNIYVVVSNDIIYTHAGLPREIIEGVTHMENLITNINLFIDREARYFTHCDNLEDRPTQNLNRLEKLFLNLGIKRLVVGHNAFLGLDLQYGEQLLDAENPDVRKYISNIHIINNLVVKLDCGTKFGSNVIKIYQSS